jgi:recombination protein RecT
MTTETKETTIAIKDCKTLPALLKHPAIQDKLSVTLKERAPQFSSALLQLTQNNGLLARANPHTVLAAGMQAALLNLPIQPSLSFAYVVPYKDQAQFQIGYKGLIQLAQRTGQFAALNDVVVEGGQLVSYNELTGELKVDFDKEPTGNHPDGYACYFRLKNGFEKTVFWPYAKVKAHAERYSQSFRSGRKGTLWETDFDKMALKTVIKHALSRYAPLSVEMQKAVEIDQATVDMDGNVVQYPDNGPDESSFDLADEVQEGEAEDVPAEEPKTKKTAAKKATSSKEAAELDLG